MNKLKNFIFQYKITLIAFIVLIAIFGNIAFEKPQDGFIANIIVTIICALIITVPVFIIEFFYNWLKKKNPPMPKVDSVTGEVIEESNNKKKYLSIGSVILAVLMLIGLGGGEDKKEIEPTPTPTAIATIAPTATVKPTPIITPTPEPTATPAPTPKPTPEPVQQVEQMVWVTATGNRYHSKSKCGRTKSSTQVPVSVAESMDLTPCGTCIG